ncbi:MAG: hypothetical protein HC831_04505 [Chloroflexia bacterium]|nr:hypothetical protein [Chloroflexia bacterium]
MKKVLVGFLSLILVGQVSFAQPVSDMAVIPIGITIQNIMRLTITKGGNIEFVFKSADDIANGIGPSAAYVTTGTVVATQAWDLNMVTDAAQFDNEGGTATLPLTTVGYATNGTGPSTGTGVALTALSNTSAVIVNAGAVTNAGTFQIDWECGTGNAPVTVIPNTTAGGRYTLNVILSLGPDL